MITRQNRMQTSRTPSKGMVIVCTIIAVWLFTAAFASAKDYSFGWSANPEPVEGYRLYYKKGGDAVAPFDGTDALNGSSPIDIGKQTTFTITGLEDNTTYHFALTAYNGSDESGFTRIITVIPEENTTTPATYGQKAFIFNWDTSLETNITAHRFFINEQFLCQSTDPAAESLTCYADLLNETMYFSMTTVDSLGNESTRTNVLIYEPPAPSKAFIFNWDTSLETDITAHRFYINEQFLCQSTDPAAESITCYADLLNETMYFSMATVDSLGNESTKSNILNYYPTASETSPDDPTSPDSAALAAVISTNSQTGEAPLAIDFDAGASTGPISSYTWTFGDGDTANGVTASHSYQAAGTYTTTLTVRDADGLSQQADIAITVTAPTAVSPNPLIGPTAVIGSSSAVGNAPFTVTFDGSGSSSPQPIVSYSWAFGDGATAEGTAVAHTYTLSGNYSPTLTVIDNAGLRAQVSTPVLISPGTEQTANEAPQSVIVTAPGFGAAPLVVTFDGSGSRDADGSIERYLWSFGDGTTATGSTAQHTFAEIATYTVTLQVTDNMGATAVSSQIVTVTPESKPTFYFELQEVQLDHDWTRFDFMQPFIDPVVVAGPAGFTESDPATVRVRNITATGCEMRIQEWEYLDGSHARETVSFIVMEKGIFTLDNGSKIEAGTFTGTTAFKKVDLQQKYSSIPVILPQVISENETDALVNRLRNISTSSFQYKMQEREQTPTAHGTEKVGYIAWQPGTGEVMGLPYEAGVTAQTVTDSWSDIVFKTDFPELPLLLAGIQSFKGADTAGLRSQNPSGNILQVKIEEERSLDEETSHIGEVVGYLTIGPQKPIAQTP